MNLDQQWLTAWYMLLAGVILGVVFDGCRTLSISFRFTKVFIWLFDCLYWIGATVLVFRLLFISNDGQFRIYVILFVLFGGLLYFRFFSSRMLKIMLFLMLPIATILRKGWHIVCVITRFKKQKE